MISFFFVPFRPKNFKIVKKKIFKRLVKNLSYNVFGDTLLPQTIMPSLMNRKHGKTKLHFHPKVFKP